MPVNAALERTESGSLFPEWAQTGRLDRFKRFSSEFLRVPHGHNAGGRFRWSKPQEAWVESVEHAEITICLVPRANAKSTTAAALALHYLFDPPEGDLSPQVVVVATSVFQAEASIYNSCIDMIEADPFLSEHAHVYRSVHSMRIEAGNGGSIKVRAADARKLQGLIPSLLILDEIGGVDVGVWSALTQALGKRPNSRLLGIGTPMADQGLLFDLKQRHDAGQLEEWIAFFDYSAPAAADIDSHKVWEAANPVRKALDPKGWKRSLQVQRSSVPEIEFRTYNLAQFVDLRGDPVVEPEVWDGLAGLTVNDDDELAALEAQGNGVMVVVDGSWNRRDLAVVAAVGDDDTVNLISLGVWEAQDEPVLIAAILDAIGSLPVPPAKVLVGRSAQVTELTAELEAQGLRVEERSTSLATTMRSATDVFLARIADGTLRHDASEHLRRQVLSAKQDVKKDGVVLARDDRTDQRIDALVSACLAAEMVAVTPVVRIW